jgi:hypothetical protein
VSRATQILKKEVNLSSKHLSSGKNSLIFGHFLKISPRPQNSNSIFSGKNAVHPSEFGHDG